MGIYIIIALIIIFDFYTTILYKGKYKDSFDFIRILITSALILCFVHMLVGINIKNKNANNPQFKKIEGEVYRKVY